MKSAACFCAVVGIALSAGACGGDGDGPSAPSSPLNVSGRWIVTSELDENSCDIEIPDRLTSAATITQTGSQLTIDYDEGTPDTGTLDVRTGNFTVQGTLEDEGVTAVSITSGRFSSNDEFEAETAATISDGFDSCTIRTNDEGRRQ